jgi:hypothetical protein
MKKNLTIIFAFILLSGFFIKLKYYTPSKLLIKAKQDVEAFNE